MTTSEELRYRLEMYIKCLAENKPAAANKHADVIRNIFGDNSKQQKLKL
jgi:hypothetical protein